MSATVGLTGLAAHALGVAGRDLAANGWLEVVLFFAVVLGYHASNTLLVSGVVAISSGDSFLGLVLASVRSSAPAEFAMAVIGGLAAFVWVTNPFWLPVGVFPAVIAQLTLRYLEASSRKSAQLQHQALHDLLTGLPNRALLRERAQQAILASGRQEHSLALLVMDLDRFKEVNDTVATTTATCSCRRPHSACGVRCGKMTPSPAWVGTSSRSCCPRRGPRRRPRSLSGS